MADKWLTELAVCRDGYRDAPKGGIPIVQLLNVI